MSISDRIRGWSKEHGAYNGPDSNDLDAWADEVAELERRVVPDGWMPYRLVHDTEDEVWVEPSGWWVEYGGMFDSRKRLMDPTPDWQAAIAAAEAAKEKPA